MMCCCEKCRFVFESIRLLEHCPDCGHGPVREATDDEIAEYASNRLEYGPMPVYGISNLHLAEGFDGAVSGDLISLHYRDYSIVCCNIALTMSPVEGFEDSYTQDDVQARKYFQIEDNQNVLFYGSVFMFFPGPDIEGNVRLTAQTPVQYLKDLQQMKLGELVTGPEHLQQRMDSLL